MSQWDETRHRLFNQKWDARIQDEARIANDITRGHPDITRTEALRIAKSYMSRAEGPILVRV